MTYLTAYCIMENLIQRSIKLICITCNVSPVIIWIAFCTAGDLHRSYLLPEDVRRTHIQKDGSRKSCRRRKCVTSYGDENRLRRTSDLNSSHSEIPIKGTPTSISGVFNNINCSLVYVRTTPASIDAQS